MKERLKERREQRHKAEGERLHQEREERFSTASDSYSSGSSGSRPSTRDSQAVTSFLTFVPHLIYSMQIFDT